MTNIRTSIICRHIAPLENLQSEITSSSLRFAIFANNGSGKTFISRLFRLLENDDALIEDGSGHYLTDAFLTYGYKDGDFNFKVVDDESEKENINIHLQAGTKPVVPSTNYIFHTFNQDYVEKNIRELDYIKNADDEGLQGFILGKAHIDVSDDKKKLEELKTVGKTKKDNIIQFVEKFKEENISKIYNITRLNEYKELDAYNILKWDGTPVHMLEKTVDEYIRDFDKIKSVPENLSSVPEVLTFTVDDKKIESIQEMLQKEFTLSEFAEDFKIKIKNKQEFIEKGLSIAKDSICPFCDRPYDKDALALVDLYTKYLTDQEAKTIKQLGEYRRYLSDLIGIIKDKEKDTNKQIKIFNEYKTKYIVSFEKEELGEINTDEVIQNIEIIISNILEKVKNISISQNVSDQQISNLKITIDSIVKIISSNNEKVKSINGRISHISEENKAVRKNICRATYAYLCESQKKEIEEVKQIAKDYRTLEEEISKKEEAIRTQKKKEVANTIKQVLNFFFDGEKYTLDEETFQLVFKERVLDKGNVKYVLSEGEKNIIAFAYYLGDTHIKINRDDDYRKLFFIIDDPISSLDFTYVYTASGVIRKLNLLFPKLGHPRYFILTHNNEFMRILCSNRIVDKRLLLQNGNLTEFNTNYTVPYISHLLDVYRVARKGQDYSHTTANSIRHIMETLVKFQNIELSDDGIDKYIQKHFEKDAKTYTFINDLSHGGWRSGEEPLLPKDYQDVCESIVCHIKDIYPNQISYCEKNA